MLLAGAAIFLVVVAAMLIEEGEVVTLETSDEVGQAYPTRLWIVEFDGKLYVRGPLERPWVQRLSLRPQVKLTRNEKTGSFRAKVIPDPSLAEAVNRAMIEKYGRADGLVDRFFNRSPPAAILLEPTGAESLPPRSGPPPVRDRSGRAAPRSARARWLCGRRACASGWSGGPRRSSY
jgi:hypothetical protein